MNTATAHYLVTLSLDTDGNPPARIQLLPAGEFAARDGRPASMTHNKVKAWRLHDRSAEHLVSARSAQQTHFLIDYEHQTVLAAQNGQPAPAAGWATQLHWDKQTGLYADVQWTARASQMIKDGEYKYISPVFEFDPQGDIIALHHAALTNHPALDGMQAVTAKLDTESIPTDNTMPLKTETLALLGLATTATAEDCHTAIAALKTAPAHPDPSQYVTLAQYEATKTELVQLKAKQHQQEVDALLQQGKATGKLLPAQEAWARELGNKDITLLKSYLDSAQAIIPTQTQTDGKPPAGHTQTAALTQEEGDVVALLGITPEEFTKAKV